MNKQVTTNTEVTKQAFPNLLKAMRKEQAQAIAQARKNLANVEEYPSIEDILKHWYYNNLIDKKLRFADKWTSRNTLIDHIVSNLKKYQADKLVKAAKHLNDIAQAPDLISGTITLEWKKSRMWGSNPRAQFREHTSENWNTYNTRSIGGCGYDKQSTAVAEAMNQSKAVLKVLYTEKNRPKNFNKSNRESIGYGSGYRAFPVLERGTGVSCFETIFKNCGYIFKCTAWGNSFDVYTIEKASKRKAK